MNLGSSFDQDIQGQPGKIYSTEVHSMFVERRVQLTRYWKEEGFESLDHSLLMCEMTDPYTSRSVQLECAGALKGK